jgi:ligand-binding sensor domain-containing protein/signal transduction histidine kinase
MRLRLAALALLLAAGPVLAAPLQFSIDSVRFQRLGIEQGLSQGAITAIAQDNRGFIWLGTEDGLSRYDGYAFAMFRREGDEHGLVDNRILALAAASDGELWIGTGDGLVRFSAESERFAASLRGSAVTALLVHRSGALWLASADGRLLRQIGDRFAEVPTASDDPPGQIRALREAAGGEVLVAAANGLWQADPDGIAAVRRGVDGLPRGNPINDALHSYDGTLWLATEQGLLQLGADGRLRRRLGRGDGLADDRVRALLHDRAGRLWVATADGLSRLDTPVAAVRSWRYRPGVDDSLPDSALQRLLIDRDGLLWVGSRRHGLALFDPRTEAVATLRAEPQQPSVRAAVAALQPGAEGLVWLGLEDGAGLLRLDLASGRATRLPEAPDEVRGLASDGAGGVWVAGGAAGLWRYAADGKLLEQLAPGGPQGLPGAAINAVLPGTDGSLWVGSDGAGLLHRCAGCSAFSPPPADPRSPGPAGDTVLALHESDDGALWIGYRRAGLDRHLPGQGRFEHFPLLGLPVGHISQDRSGAIWVASLGGGLQRIERDARNRWRTSRFGRLEGLPSESVAAVIEDRHGRLWVATGAGLSRLEPRSGGIDTFGPRSGALPGGYAAAAAARLADGRLLFGGARGLSLFDPGEMRPPPAPRQVAASEVRVFEPGGRRARLDSRRYREFDQGRMQLRLPGDANDFQIELAALSFAAPDEIRYEYRLDGLESDWIATDPRNRLAIYTDVPPGDYLFRARARRDSGQPGAELQLPVSVRPAPDPAAWLRLLLLVAAAVLALSVGWLLWMRARERAQAADHLRESEARLKLALWGTGDELWDLDLAGHRMRRENPLRHLRVTAAGDGVDAAVLAEAIHPEDRAGFERAMRAVIRGDSDHLDSVYRAEGADGHWYWLRTRGRVVARDARGRALRVAGTVSDVSELHEQQVALERINRELEQRVRERTRALSSANSELGSAIEQLTRTQGQLVEREKMAALGSLVAGVAHEINTPLGIGVTAASHLQSAARELRSKLGSGQLSRVELDNFTRLTCDGAELILRNLERADKLVKSFKQVAVDQSSDQQRRIDLAEYLDEIVTSLRPALKRGRHRVEIEVDGAVILDTLPGPIYQSIANLVQNSLLHGFGERSEGLIRILARRDGGDCVIEYSDDGVGMDEETCRRVFEPFFTTRRGHGGSGLGMHIVYNLVTQALRGTISCRSRPGEGVLFRLSFPAILPLGQGG